MSGNVMSMKFMKRKDDMDEVFEEEERNHVMRRKTAAASPTVAWALERGSSAMWANSLPTSKRAPRDGGTGFQEHARWDLVYPIVANA